MAKTRKRDVFLKNKMWLNAKWWDWSHVSAALMTPVVGDTVVSHRQHQT